MTIQSVEQQQEHQDGAGSTVTLLVKHLPEALPADTLKRLFSHYGASDARLCVSGRLKNWAFVDFRDESLAARAQSQLHRLRFLGKILSVERAKPVGENRSSGFPGSSKDGAGPGYVEKKQRAGQDPPPLPAYPYPQEERSLQSVQRAEIDSKSTLGMPMHKSEPIAPRLGVDYPFPPHLEYAYPPPDGNILTNIVNALIAVPRFYTQVLHLMNKMNLPAPFRPALPTPPLPPAEPAPVLPKRKAGELSSDESELESSEEIGSDDNKQLDKDAEVESGTRQATRKRAKHRIRGAAEDTGPKPTTLVPKEKPMIKKRQPILHINISTKGLTDTMQEKGDQEKAERDKPTMVEAADEKMKEDISNPKLSATEADLAAGRIPLSEILALPMFKSYMAGNPTPVLYIKNLAKDVSQEDLYYVFGAFFPSSDDAKSQLGVKLMQEGRMRGQAFVTFPSTELAEGALNATHGYVLKGKPMVVQFGRKPSAGKLS